MIRKIAVVGLGGVGGYFGGKIGQLLSHKEIELYFIARGNHLEAIKKDGLYLSTEKEGDMVCHPTLATDQISQLPSLDLILLCVKSYDLNTVLQLLKDKIEDHTIILPLLNGVDIYERVREVIHKAIILPATVFVGTHIEKAGKVTQKGGACKILMCHDPKHIDVTPVDLFNLFSESKIKYEWFHNVTAEIWKKYLFIASFGLVTAAYNKSVGEVMASNDLSDNTLSIISEIYNLSQKKGVNLPQEIIEMSFNKGNDFPYETKTSFQRDFENMERQDERDLFGGTILRMSQQLGCESPVTQRIYSKLHQMKPDKMEV